MNKENAAEYLPLVQALAEGKTSQIDYQGNENWIDGLNLDLSYEPSRYRIKPELREWSMVVGNDGKLYQPELCRAFAQSLTIRVREILD
jgi:hypothetical protein